MLGGGGGQFSGGKVRKFEDVELMETLKGTMSQ